MRIAGHAAVWGRVDRAGDVFAPGAFAGASPVPLLWQHRGRPVGMVERVVEDATGLLVTARVDDPAVARLVREGALTGLSVGFRTLAARMGARRVIGRAALVEVSLVAVPMQPAARVTMVSEEENG